MQPVVTAATIAPAAQFSGQAVLFAPGQTIEATVLSLLDDGAVRIAIADRIVEVRSEIALVPGATLRFAVKSVPEGLRLIPIPGSVRLPQSAIGTAPAPERPLPPESTINAPAVRAETRASLPSAGVEPSGSPTAPLRPPEALAAAVRVAVTRQGGLAPLFAALLQIADPGRTAMADGDSATSGRDAAAVPVPDTVRTIARHLLGNRLDLDAPLTADRLRQAMSASGLFLEQNLAAGRNDVPDLKLLLVTFRQALRSWLEAMPPAGAGPRMPSPAQPGAAAVLHAPPQSAQAPPPPYRGMPPTAQPVAPAVLSEAMTPSEIGHRLLEQTEAALSRQTLLQSASVTDTHERARPESAGARWLFEVPLATPGGTSVAQFEITRDGRSGGDGEEPASPVWRARFSIDVEPLGPVHAQVALAGSRATVSLWAERPSVADTLRAQANDLSERLAAAELEPGDILVRAGEPRAPRSDRPPPGRFLDQAS